MSERLLSEETSLVKPARRRELGQRGAIVWLTGLSGSGKSTLARNFERELVESGRPSLVLDGDRIRRGLCRDLGFAPADRHENLRRVAEAAKLLAEAGVIVVVATISPYRADREAARGIAGGLPFIEVHLSTCIDVCEARDSKGLYRKARAGELRQFTGVDAPYEMPENPELRIDTATQPVEAGVAALRVALAEAESRG